MLVCEIDAKYCREIPVEIRPSHMYRFQNPNNKNIQTQMKWLLKTRNEKYQCKDIIMKAIKQADCGLNRDIFEVAIKAMAEQPIAWTVVCSNVLANGYIVGIAVDSLPNLNIQTIKQIIPPVCIECRLFYGKAIDIIDTNSSDPSVLNVTQTQTQTQTHALPIPPPPPPRNNRSNLQMQIQTQTLQNNTSKQQPKRKKLTKAQKQAKVKR